MTAQDRVWVAAKLAKVVDMSKPLAEVLDMLAIRAHAEMCRWCGKRVTLPKLRQRLHEEVVAGNMGTAEQVANAAAAVLGQIVNKG